MSIRKKYHCFDFLASLFLLFIHFRTILSRLYSHELLPILIASIVIATWHSTILALSLNSSILYFYLFIFDRHICCSTHKVYLLTDFVCYYILTSFINCPLTSFNYNQTYLFTYYHLVGMNRRFLGIYILRKLQVQSPFTLLGKQAI